MLPLTQRIFWLQSLSQSVKRQHLLEHYGEIISVNKRYWRAVPSDFQIEPDDIGKLTLFDFDAEIGEDRKIYSTRKMLKSSVMLESEYLTTLSK